VHTLNIFILHMGATVSCHAFEWFLSSACTVASLRERGGGADRPRVTPCRDRGLHFNESSIFGGRNYKEHWTNDHVEGERVEVVDDD